ASYTSLALYSRLRLRGTASAGTGQRVLAQFVEGLSFVGHNFVFSCLIALALFNSLFAMSYLTLLPIFADAYFHAGSTGYGLLKVPDHLRGRVTSLYSRCWNLLPLGGLLAGALAAAVDARFAVLFGGAMVAANALLLLASRRLRAIS